ATFGDDRTVNGDQLRAIRKRALDLHFVNQLGHAFHHVLTAEQLAAKVHQLGDGPAVPNELEHLRGDERDGFGMIQPHTAGETFLGERTSLVQHKLVEFLRCEMHNYLPDISYPTLLTDII